MAGGGGSTFSSTDIFTINAQAVNHFTISLTGNLRLSGAIVSKTTRKRSIAANLKLTSSVAYSVESSKSKIDKKTYMYKVYDESNNFIGIWNDVISEPEWSQEINSAGSTMQVVLARNSDSRVPELEPLQDNTLAHILDNASDDIYTSVKSTKQVGPGSTVSHNYRVDVWAFYGQNPGDNSSIAQPNGIKKFSGFISEINSKYGSDENTEVLLMSYGYDLDQYVVSSGSYLSNGHFNVDLGGWTAFNTNIARDTVTFHSGVASMKVTQGSQTSRVVYLSTPSWLTANSTVRVVCWIKSVSATGTFFINQGGTTTETPSSFAINSSTWTRCEFSVATGATPTGNLDFASNDTDFYIDDVQVYGITPKNNTATTVAFNSYDPSRILVEGLTQFTLNSSPSTFTTYAVSTVDMTKTVVSYTFKVNTYKDLLDTVVKLSPQGWYYYIDLADNLVHFRNKSVNADHTFYLGKHIKSLSLNSYIGDVENDLLFTGGGTPALYRRYTRTPLAGTRRGLKKMSDNRVTLSSSADILATGELDAKSGIQYRSTVSILDRTYDIETIKVGDVVAFRNFGNYVDGLKMQIVGLTYSPEMITLKLDTIPPSVPKRLEDLKRALAAQENDAAPTTPV